MKPLLAGEVTDPTKLRFPILASPKYDGIRGLVTDGQLVSRTLKPIPNRHIRETLSLHILKGFDGELISGDSFQETTGNVMRHDGEPVFTYFVFDDFSDPSLGFAERLGNLRVRLSKIFMQSNHLPMCIEEAPVYECADWEEVSRLFDGMLRDGFEGLMLRDPEGVYKFGRSTEREGILLKLKQFKDDEAAIVGFVELQHNGNEAKKDAFGRTKRSSSKAGKRGAGTLGALVMFHDEFGQFEIGTGFSAKQRQDIWDNRPDYLGKLAKFRYQPDGMKDKPRIPSFQGIRHPDDM